MSQLFFYRPACRINLRSAPNFDKQTVSTPLEAYSVVELTKKNSGTFPCPRSPSQHILNYIISSVIINRLEGQINKIASCCSCTIYATGNAQSAQLELNLPDYPNTTIRKRSHYSTSLNSKELSSARPWMEETKTHINRYFTTSVLVQAAAVVRGNSLRGLFNKSCRCCACSCWGK